MKIKGHLFRSALNEKNWARFGMANCATIAHSWPVITTEVACKFVVEQGISEEEAPKQGMEAKSEEFTGKGAKVRIEER